MTTPFRGPIAVGLLAIFAVACGGSEPAAPPATMAPATTAAAPATVAAAAPAAGSEFGVPECDSYMTKYRACLDKNVPENMRGTYKQAFEQTAASWRQAAATPQGKAGLAAGCVQAEAMAKQAMQPYGCSW